MEHLRKQPKVPRLPGLPSSRTGAIVLAVACALAATIVIVVALSNYRKSVDATVRQDTVLVATGAIRKGTSADAAAAQQLLKPTVVVSKSMAVGAVGNTALLRGRVATRDIVAGEQLTLTDFAAAGGVAAQLAGSQRAMAVPLDSSHGLVGTLQAGDRVDVYGGFQVQSPNGPSLPVTKLLIADAQVLRAGGATGTSLGSSGGQGANVLLAVNDNQAATLAFASDNGKVWLVLRPTNAANANRDITSIDSVLLNARSSLNSAGGGALSFGGGTSLSSATGSGSSSNGGSGGSSGSSTSGGRP